MRKIALTLVVILGLFVAKAEPDTPVDEKFVPTEEARRLCYHEDERTHDITFIYDPANWGRKFADISEVSIGGTFNAWPTTSHPDYMFQSDPEQEIFYLTVPYDVVKRPGKMGQPEYRFIVNGSYVNPYSMYPTDHIYTGGGTWNMVVYFSFDDIAEIREAYTDGRVTRRLNSFDLTTREGKEELCNYRLVPGTELLYRCYHPFKATQRSYNDPEPYRLQYITELAKADGVKADISLNGNRTGTLTTYTAGGETYQEEIPAYYQEIIESGRVLYVGQGYRTPGFDYVYYSSNEDDFGRWIRDIVTFINDPDTKGAIMIHCQLGVDRTGVICGVLAAFCGATWDEVVADYVKSNRLGVNDYRSPKLLRYSFENMLGVSNLDDVPSFSQAVKDHFVDGGWLAKDDIDNLRQRLNDANESTSVGQLHAATDQEEAPAFYNLQGVRVERPTGGMYVVRRGTAVEKQIVR